MVEAMVCRRRRSERSKNKLGFIEGTLKKLILKEGDDPLELQTWEIANSVICSWILNVIDPKVQTSITYVETMELTWENLKKCYAYLTL